MAWKLKDTIPPEPTSVTDLIDGDLDEVVELKLGQKGLRCLPDDLGRLRNLRVLDVSGNMLQILPSRIGDLTRLSQLMLNNNPLRTLPAALKQLSALNVLSLVGAAIDSFPAGLDQMPVRSLWLSHLPDNLPAWSLDSLSLWDMPEAKIEVAIATFPTITNLVLTNNGLSALPPALATLDLVKLDIVIQSFVSFPDLRIFPNLQRAVLIECGIRFLPDWIGSQPHLAMLSLINNKITTLPRQLADLGDDLDLTLGGNPLAPPLDQLAHQGTPALFAYLRSLPVDESPAPDPLQTAAMVPEQQVAPLLTQVIDGRLVPAPQVPPIEAEQPQLQAMHGETLDWARQTLDRTGNHPLLNRMVQRCVSLLGERVQALQVLPLAFANDRLRLVLEDYANGNDDPLSAEQRGMCNGLIGNIHMLLNWTQEWQEYKRKSQNAPVSADAAGQVHDLLKILAEALEPYRQAVDPALPPAINDLAEAARPGQKAEMVHGAMDGLNNVLAPMARHSLLRLTDKDKEEVRKTVVQWCTKAVLNGSLVLAVATATFILRYSPDLMALAQALPLDYGWLRQVIAALRGMISG